MHLRLLERLWKLSPLPLFDGRVLLPFRHAACDWKLRNNCCTGRVWCWPWSSKRTTDTLKKTAAVELSIVLKADLPDGSVLQHEWAFTYTSVQQNWRGGDMWEHTRVLTTCRNSDKPEQWLMGDRWMGENGPEMCSILIAKQERFDA